MPFSRKTKIITGLAILAIIVIIIVVVVVVYKKRKCKQQFTERMTQIPIQKYKMELKLFKSMSPDEQINYLNMDRDQKLAAYGQQLLG